MHKTHSSSTVAQRPLGVRVIVTICPQPRIGTVSCKPNGEGIPALRRIWPEMAENSLTHRVEVERLRAMLSKVARQDDDNFPPDKKQKSTAPDASVEGKIW